MDKQLLRARMCALRVAFGDISQVAYSAYDARFELAGEMERWLTRPAPDDDSAVHRAETTADRLGYERCDMTWRTGDGAGHLCVYPPGHEKRTTGDREHRCSCGDVLDASATER